MVFHENRLVSDDSDEISFHIFFRKSGKMSQNLSSAAVVVGVLKVKLLIFRLTFSQLFLEKVSTYIWM